MIKIVDYGLGNVQAFMNVYKRLGIPAERARTPADLDGARHVILPGVGSFDHAVEQFEASGMRDPLDRLVAQGETRVLGICVGMQMMATSSDEGRRSGLGWVPGRVKSFASEPVMRSLPMPHMGWNDVSLQNDCQLFANSEGPDRFYFLHSYFFECDSPDDVLARTDYGISFHSAVRHGQVYGVQFHPEKSHNWGTSLLRNFATI